jgi:hypothetical protein
MSKANVHDRRSIERVYPPDALARDAAENDQASIDRLKGVRIASAPDEAGDFELDPAARYAGEVPGAVFLAPFHRRTPSGDGGAGSDSRQGYDEFIDDIIEAAWRHGYRATASPGPGDARLRGERQ